MRETFMRAALDQARLALERGEVPVGAAVVFEGRIVALAGNERERTKDPTAHAEILALRRASQVLGRRRLYGCALYVTLEPCPMCAGAAAMAGVDSVVFGAYDARAGCAGSVYTLPEDPAFGARAVCEGGLLQEECIALLRAFFETHRENANPAPDIPREERNHHGGQTTLFDA